MSSRGNSVSELHTFHLEACAVCIWHPGLKGRILVGIANMQRKGLSQKLEIFDTAFEKTMVVLMIWSS